MRRAQDQKRFTILEVAADWHELMIPQRSMRPSITRPSEQLDPRFAASRHTTAPIPPQYHFLVNYLLPSRAVERLLSPSPKKRGDNVLGKTLFATGDIEKKNKNKQTKFGLPSKFIHLYFGHVQRF